MLASWLATKPRVDWSNAGLDKSIVPHTLLQDPPFSGLGFQFGLAALLCFDSIRSCSRSDQCPRHYVIFLLSLSPSVALRVFPARPCPALGLDVKLEADMIETSCYSRDSAVACSVLLQLLYATAGSRLRIL